MEYRYLGPTGLKVSVVSWGNWVNNASDQLTVDSVKFCLEHGINFFDTAEIYGHGGAEISLGKAFKELNVQREKIVVSTKIFNCGTDPNDSFLSRKHIIERIRNPLRDFNLIMLMLSFVIDMIDILL
jgi:aryl-alcohol dehydrogenase-like predicted oxidoreductase